MHEKPGGIIETDVIIEKDDEDWNREGIMTAEEVKVSGLQCKMRALQEKYCSVSVGVLLTGQL